MSQLLGIASAQVALNQFALGPVVLAVSFAWNLVLTGQARKFASKLRNDGPPSMVNGAPQRQATQGPGWESTVLNSVYPMTLPLAVCDCRVEVLGASFRRQLLAGAPQTAGGFDAVHRASAVLYWWSYVLEPLTTLCHATGIVHVDLRHALDWLPVVRV
jgi:hypothetical protein